MLPGCSQLGGQVAAEAVAHHIAWFLDHLSDEVCQQVRPGVDGEPQLLVCTPTTQGPQVPPAKKVLVRLQHISDLCDSCRNLVDMKSWCSFHLPGLLDAARTTPALADPVPTLDGCQKGVAADLITDEHRPQTHGPKGSFALPSPVACATRYATSLND